ALEPGHLRGAAGDDLAGIRVTVDLGVEVVNQGREVRLQERAEGPDLAGVFLGPAHVLLKLLVAARQSVGLHPRPPPQHPNETGPPPQQAVARRAVMPEPCGPPWTAGSRRHSTPHGAPRVGGALHAKRGVVSPKFALTRLSLIG